VPLVFKTDIAGTFSISLPKTEGVFTEGQNVFLRDSFTNTLHNLNGGAYTFTTEIGDFNNRFNLEYQELLSVNPNQFTENQVVIYRQKQDFVINSGTAIMKLVQVYDVRGRLLLDKNNVNSSETKFNVGNTNQVLLVKITSEDNVVVTKKVIQ
jgi:hypothetical protein